MECSTECESITQIIEQTLQNLQSLDVPHHVFLITHNLKKVPITFRRQLLIILAIFLTLVLMKPLKMFFHANNGEHSDAPNVILHKFNTEYLCMKLINVSLTFSSNVQL